MENNRIQYLNHKGKKVIFCDYSNIPTEQVLKLIVEEAKTASLEGLNSALVLCDYTNTHFNLSIVNAFNKVVPEYSKYYKAQAFIGVTGLVKVMFDASSKLAKQELKIFNKKEDALDWLTSK